MEFRILGPLEVLDRGRSFAWARVVSAPSWPCCSSVRTRWSRATVSWRSCGTTSPPRRRRRCSRSTSGSCARPLDDRALDPAVGASRRAAGLPASRRPGRARRVAVRTPVRRRAAGEGRGAAGRSRDPPGGGRALARARARRVCGSFLCSSRGRPAGGGSPGRARGTHQRRPRSRAATPTSSRSSKTLVAAQPLRERLRGQLMLALYRS